MSAQNAIEFDAADIDVRVVGGVAVLTLDTEQGRLIVSTQPQVVERLSLSIQMELVQAPLPLNSRGQSWPSGIHGDP